MIFIRIVIACILSVVHTNSPMFQWILTAKGLLPFHSSTEGGANERKFDSHGDILLVDSCTLPFAVCLEMFSSSFAWMYVVAYSLRLQSETDSKYNAF